MIAERVVGTFPALAIPNYRRYLAGQSVSFIGTWMQMTALAWLVLTLSDSPSALGVVVARLVDEGLLERNQHPDDGRVVVVRATGAGVALCDDIRRARTDVLAHELERLSTEEAAALEAALPVLERLASRLKERRE